MPDANALHDRIASNADRDLNDLLNLLRIPSVSTDPSRTSAMRETVDYLSRDLQAAGFQTSVWETGGHPALFAERTIDASKPTVLVYGHYDVQPADPLELWDSDPFDPQIVDGRIVARGASDDKGQVYAHVKAVLALHEATGTLPCNVKFLIEGEEEIGSPNLGATVEAHGKDLQSDVVLISDGAMLPGPTPTLTYGLRGLAYLEVRVTTADRDLHSGAYGGAAPNPIQALAEMIAGLKDDQGRITVPAFYDHVRELGDDERTQLERVPFDADAFQNDAGLTATPGEPGYSVLERLWARPTLDVNGIGGGFQGEGSKTVIPSSAFAKISCRLVPDQDPAAIANALEAHLKRVAPHNANVEVLQHAHGRWALSPLDGDGMTAATQAIRAVDGVDPVYVRTGGSIPVVADFQRLLGSDVVLLDMGLESDRIHSPNETFDVALYHRGIRVSAEFFRAIGQGG